jgi:hypothetical protein
MRRAVPSLLSCLLRRCECPFRAGRLGSGALVLLAAIGAAACNMIDTDLARNAELSHMVPASSDEAGELECWLTVEFKRYPKGGNLRDVVVRFESIALAEPAEFDWEYIASRDKRTRREGFGAGLHEAEMTTPVSRPPLGQPTMVRFPLRARHVIDDAPDILYLEVELYWGGERQDSLRRTIEHVYSTQPGMLEGG